MDWNPLVRDLNERADQSNLTSPTMAAGDVAQRMTCWGDRGQYGQCCLHATPIQVDAIGLAEPSSVMREVCTKTILFMLALSLSYSKKSTFRSCIVSDIGCRSNQ